MQGVETCDKVQRIEAPSRYKAIDNSLCNEAIKKYAPSLTAETPRLNFVTPNTLLAFS